MVLIPEGLHLSSLVFLIVCRGIKLRFTSCIQRLQETKSNSVAFLDLCFYCSSWSVASVVIRIYRGFVCMASCIVSFSSHRPWQGLLKISSKVNLLWLDSTSTTVSVIGLLRFHISHYRRRDILKGIFSSFYNLCVHIMHVQKIKFQKNCALGYHHLVCITTWNNEQA